MTRRRGDCGLLSALAPIDPVRLHLSVDVLEREPPEVRERGLYQSAKSLFLVGELRVFQC